jgi:hypothetical protein
VTSASHDLALAWHPVLSSSSPLLSSFLSLDVLHTHPIQLILLPEHQPRDVINAVRWCLGLSNRERKGLVSSWRVKMGEGLALKEQRLKHELFLDSNLLAKGQSR